ncbi:acetyl-CoA carboxylase biotin carboxyl carrier protein [Aquibacillus albus]|uniref:Biotin carboxyl carrier protein of acetyl-CoA carboxylase n=1 Tax=Aquibacillus albus TaxID=1168171 RepID=A0ABS2MV69_9BACI|nr:acetyl-CoA carboxylase biotin carboxyl carrier protein [Aquibacillus albus]MBM7569703.1 acetyl-CoA carboxylase biotin carboxyl carrier protein [Aquibacillus albus]
MLKIQEIHELIKRIDESSIDEFTFETDGTKLSLKKNKEQVVTTQPTFASAQPSAQPSIHTELTEQTTNTETVTKSDTPKDASVTKAEYDHEIVSPMVGTFYHAPSPDKDPFVQVGDKVQADTIVCIVEAMKLFNEIEADVNGEIVEILVENGELVEYGQPLFRVKTV